MTNLRDVECLTADEVDRLLGPRDFDGNYWPNLSHEDAQRALLSLKLTVSMLQSCFSQYWWMDDDHRAVTKEAFATMHGASLKQAEQLGIYGEGT